MRPSKTEIQKRDSDSVRQAKTGDDNKFMLRTDLWMIAGSAVIGLSTLIALSFALWGGRILFVVGAALPLFTLIAIIYQAVVYRRQWNVMQNNLQQTDRVIETMREQRTEMKAQTDAMIQQARAASVSVDQNKESIKAVKDQLDIMRESMKTERRAYVGIARMNIDLVHKKRLWIHLNNTGKTPASDVKAKIQVTTSTPNNWHETRPQNVRLFGLGEEEYSFNLTTIHPDSIAVQIGFPLGRHFSDEELALVVQKDSRLTVNLTLDYYDGFDKEFAYFVITYRGKDTHGYDTWGIFPTETEKEYDQTNPEPPEWTEWKIL